MKKTNPAFKSTLNEATNWLMQEFSKWNAVQKELKEKGYEHNYYSETEAEHNRNLFRVIAERFVLEDVDYKRWQWLETPWAGTDGNTGMEAYIINFVTTDSLEEGWGIISFYVTRNRRFWFAIPLTELATEDGLFTYEANAIQDVFDVPMRIA